MMRCEDALSRAAELDGADPAVAAHLAACTDCRAVLEEARAAAASLGGYERCGGDGELPAADSGAAWTDARRDAVREARPTVRALRATGRVAAVLLAAVGALALLGARVESEAGRAAFVLAIPWPADEPSDAAQLEPAAADAARSAALAARLDQVAERLEAAERQRDERLSRWAGDLAVARADDLRGIAAEIVALRREVAALRFAMASLTDATAAIPALPDAP